MTPINHRLSYRQQEAHTQLRLMARYYIGQTLRHRLAGCHERAATMWAEAKTCASCARNVEREAV